MSIKNIFIAVLAVVLSTGCNGQNKNNAETRHDTSLLRNEEKHRT